MAKYLPKVMIILLAGFGSLQAQFPTDIVQADITLDRTTVRAGEQVTLQVNIEIEEGWHLYSSDLEGYGPIPTHFEVAESSPVSAMGPFNEPPPQRTWDEGFEREVGWHSGRLKVSQAVLLNEDLEAGPTTLAGNFVFMACTETMCLTPYYQPFTFDLSVEEGPVRAAFAFTGDGIDLSRKISGLEGTELQRAIQDGFGSFLLLAMGMGFLALLTPCVFPMIPITVSFFLKQGELGQMKPVKAAGLYGGGIVVIYTVLGLLLALTLGAAGANQLASNPWVNLILGALFIYFALSLLGLYEIQMPSRLRQFSLAQESRGGALGIFFMALTFTITSFTCTVQFVGLLLVAASQGHYIWPAVGLVFYSITFALPFFLLALFPQYIARLPKSGGWLNSVKVVMGFLEIAAALKFISNSDLVWNWGFFDHQVVLAAWIILAFLTGFYILGKIRLPHDSAIDRVSVQRLFGSTAFLIFGLLLIPGLLGQRIPSLVEAYLPPRLESDSGGIALGRNLAQLRWHDTYDDAIAEARQTNMPIFLDVTGYTCTNCRWMEANIFTRRAVADRFKSFILLRLYTDGGENFREKQQFVIDRFGTAALPLYVILDPDGRELARFPGMTRDEEEFTDFMDQGMTPQLGIR